MLSRIQFYTKEERMTHPLARLFSEAMWQTVFHGELDAIYQVLMLESHEERLQEIIVSCQAQSFNTANNISKASVRSTLPPWINFAGKFSPSSEDLIYNSSTKEIIWNIGNIPRGTGITTTGKEVSFVVTFIPSLSQVNTIPVIINDATLTGHDDFANLDIRVNKASLNTRLVNDSAFPSNGDRVVE